MVPMSKIVSLLPEGYGYVILVGCVGNTFLNFWLVSNVEQARKRFDVPYPDVYSNTSKEFNCIQRAHQNTVENQSGFLMLLFISGLQLPKFSAGAGALYLLSRIAYARGYYSGDQNKDVRGGFGYLGFFGLLGGTVCLAVKHLRCL